ncbi:hypothetical protein [Faecalibacter sp. LW9]|uniref:hypothetical protein n=1 Tax=Faecalibacter sp. LW9 TaxID=3103144 RepID=UPI002AFE5588|nr:hypothetical protein [Faecalibacter sp. LW9]
MKYLYIITIFSLSIINLNAQVAIGIIDEIDPQSTLDVESLYIRGKLKNPNNDGEEREYYRILSNGYPGWSDLPQPVDFTGSIMIKDKMIMESSQGELIRNIYETGSDNENSSLNVPGTTWKLMNGLKTSFTFDYPTNSISAQFQTMVAKYSNSDRNIVSYSCGFFVKKTSEGDDKYRLKVIRPEVIIGPKNSFKVLTVSGVINKTGEFINNVEQSFVPGVSYDIAVACRGLNVNGSDNYLRIGREALSTDPSNSKDDATLSLLKSTNVKSTFIVEQYETPS